MIFSIKSTNPSVQTPLSNTSTVLVMVKSSMNCNERSTDDLINTPVKNLINNNVYLPWMWRIDLPTALTPPPETITSLTSKTFST